MKRILRWLFGGSKVETTTWTLCTLVIGLTFAVSSAMLLAENYSLTTAPKEPEPVKLWVMLGIGMGLYVLSVVSMKWKKKEEQK